MKKIENECWSDKSPYYIIYEDKSFLKDIYSQVFDSLPDVGEIAYIGASTHKFSKDYSLNGENIDCKDNKETNKDINCEKGLRKENRHRAGVNILDVKEESEIREYANIKEIKEMNNKLFYKQLIRNLVYKCINKECNKLSYIKDRIRLYDSYKEDEDIFVKMGDSCIWLKKSNMDTSIINMANIIGDVNMLGYIIKEETTSTPRVIKVLAIYV